MNDYLRATFFATANFVFVVSFVLVSAAQSVAQSPTPKIPRLDRALYPQAYGVLGSEHLMYPVDVSDWPVQITNEHQLFVDDYLVATCTDLTRQLHQAKRHGGPVLRLLGTPWEQASSGSLIVLRDENSGLFRMWYGIRSLVKADNDRPGWKQVAIELTASRDGGNWSRVCPGELILPLGAKGSWDADYLSPMTGQPLLVGDELWFYYLGAVRWERLKALGVPNPRDELNPGMANDEMHIGLAKLRRDGFVSLNAGEQPGMLVTRPLTFRSGKLYVNAEIANDGYLKVEVRNADGTAVEPYRLDACEAVIGDALKAPVSWAGESKLTCPKDQCQRLAFQLRKAKLYSFWIE